MIKAVVFDCFGVLVNDGWLPFKQKYFGHDSALAQEATDSNKAVDAGLISYDDFITQVAELAGIEKHAAHTEIEQNPADTMLLDFIKNELKPSYKIGMLSNAGADWLRDLLSPDQLALFDATALSFELGMIKPEAGCYTTIADRLSVDPSECVFIDDQVRYCDGAVATGMRAIHFRDTASCINELTTLLKPNTNTVT